MSADRDAQFPKTIYDLEGFRALTWNTNLNKRLSELPVRDQLTIIADIQEALDKRIQVFERQAEKEKKFEQCEAQKEKENMDAKIYGTDLSFKEVRHV